MGPAEQHEHPGVGAAVFTEPRGEESTVVSGELLAEEQASRGQREERARVRVDHSRRSTAQVRYGDRGQRSAATGAGDLASVRVLRCRKVEGPRWRLRRAR